MHYFSISTFRTFVTSFLGIAMLSPVLADDGIDPASLKFTSVTGGRYLTNPNLTSLNPLDAAAGAQDLGITYSQGLTRNWSFSVGGGATVDRENRKGFSSDLSNADFGLTYKEGSWSYTLGATKYWVFAPTFQPLSTRFTDVGFAATSDDFALGSFGFIQFQYGIRERFHDVLGSSHVSPVVRATFKKPLMNDWTFAAALAGRYTYFLQNPLETRDFTLTEQISLTKKLSNVASLRFIAIHDDRFSSVDARTADGWTFGASLTVSTELLGSAK